MSTLGQKIYRWTHSEIMRLHLLHSAGKSRKEIATELGMSEERVRGRFNWEVRNRTLRYRGAKRETISPERRERQKIETRSPHIGPVTAGPRPTAQALIDRALRYAALPRDLAGAFFGDPPIGFSALERRT